MIANRHVYEALDDLLVPRAAPVPITKATAKSTKSTKRAQIKALPVAA